MTWLSDLVAPLQSVLFNVGNDAVSWAELLGFVTGAACVWLTVKTSIHNFWVGIANSAFFLVLFSSARLWADAALQLVFILLGIIGWWQWLHGGAHQKALVVGRASPRTLANAVVFVAGGAWGLTLLLGASNDVAPFFDALTTSLSLAAQYLLNRKRLESWLFWMAADLIYIPLYSVKRLDLTAIVYALFLCMSVLGLRGWLEAHRGEVRSSAPSVGAAGGEPVGA